MSRLFASGGQNVGVSASTSVLPMSIQGCFPLGWIGSTGPQCKQSFVKTGHLDLILQAAGSYPRLLSVVKSSCLGKLMGLGGWDIWSMNCLGDAGRNAVCKASIGQGEGPSL